MMKVMTAVFLALYTSVKHARVVHFLFAMTEGLAKAKAIHRRGSDLESSGAYPKWP